MPKKKWSCPQVKELDVLLTESDEASGGILALLAFLFGDSGGHGNDVCPRS